MMTTEKFTPLPELINLKGKVALVTGGAMGIGFAISFRLAEAGASIVIADVNDEKARQAVPKLQSYGYQVKSWRCNVSQEGEVRNLVQTVVAEMGRIDILVNNAGIYPQIPLAEMTGDNFEQVISVNLKGTFLCSREVSQQMIKQGGDGCMINIASVDAVHPSAGGLSAYDASKGGVLSLTKNLALELAPHEIRVNAIAPGSILTEGLIAQLGSTSTEQGKAQLKAFLARIPLRRMGKPDDIGRVALFLASDLASYITGSLFVVDGGYLIS